MDSIVFLCPEQYSLGVTDNDGRKAWTKIAAEASHEIALKGGTDISVNERTERINELLIQVMKRSQKGGLT